MRAFVAGGAGFIGSHLVERLIANSAEKVVVYDNFSSGRVTHLSHIDESRLHIVRADIKDLPTLIESIADAEVVYHVAANPDIAKAINQPDIDFWEGTYLTHNILEAMRLNGIKKIIYASGSGVYGETGLLKVHEDYGPLLPISTYGASKLSCEALICSYCHMFDMVARVYRFANVIGPRQTHGVAYDFIRYLRENPYRLAKDITGIGFRTADGIAAKIGIAVDSIHRLKAGVVHILERATDVRARPPSRRRVRARVLARPSRRRSPGRVRRLRAAGARRRPRRSRRRRPRRLRRGPPRRDPRGTRPAT